MEGLDVGAWLEELGLGQYRALFADQAIESCIIDPVVSNRGAIRAYEKAGFRFLKEITNTGAAEAQYLMRISRAEFAKAGTHTPN